MTALTAASREGHIIIVNALISAGAEFNTQDKVRAAVAVYDERCGCGPVEEADGVWVCLLFYKYFTFFQFP